ncbi:MAG: hypothetical protein M1607_02915 [Patescibacteria group bacterium]|nr:hypothetical protein [Patescibacteria group bacterium]
MKKIIKLIGYSKLSYLLTSKFSLLLIICCGSLLAVNVSPSYAEDLVISGNGSSSTNQVSAEQSSQTVISQNNSSQTNNNVDQSSSSGSNSIDSSTGNSNITTGSVQTDTSTTNSGNSSSVNSDCCNQSGQSLQITNNGSSSSNSINASSQTDSQVVAKSDSTISNSVQAYANSGKNGVSVNTGDVTIKTGDIKTSNKTVNQGINHASVNLPQSNSSLDDIEISGNGAGSLNKAKLQKEAANLVDIENQANISNNQQTSGISGENNTERNSGNVQITTGNVATGTEVLNQSVNTNQVSLKCCSQQTKSSDPGGSNSPQGGSPIDPASNPTSAPTPSTSPASITGNTGQVLAASTGSVGEVLAATGNNFTLFINIASLLVLLLGLYLRMHPGRDPNYAIVN